MNTVLVATERDIEQNLLTQALHAQGYDIIRSRDGLDAIEAARNKSPQLLLVNVALPKLDGFALFRRFQQDEQLRRIPIVLFSTRSNDQKSERFAQELGAVHFVGNALKPGALNGVLDAALAAGAAPPLPAIELLQRPTPVEPAKAVLAKQESDPAPVERTLKIPALIELPAAVQLQQLEAEHVQLRAALATAQQQADSAQVWQSMFVSSPVAMWVVGKNSQKILAVNDAAVRLFGYSQAEFLQLDSPTALRDPGQANTTNVFAFRSKDGRALSLLVNTRELSFKAQVAELFVAHDVSYRVRGERAMADEVQRNKALLLALPVAYWTITADAQLSDANAASGRLLGYSREQLLEHGLSRLLIDPAQASALRALTPGQRLLTKMTHQDRSLLNVEFTAGQTELGTGLRLLVLQIVPDPDTVEMKMVQPVGTPKLTAVLEMLRYAEDADESTLLQYAMAQLASAFDSPLALFAAVERVTQTLEVCATSHQAKRRSPAAGNIAVPAAWKKLLAPHTVCSSDLADESLLVEGLPEISNYVACSTMHSRELWILVVANRDGHYTETEQRELHECAGVLATLVARMRQQGRLHAAVVRSEAVTSNMVTLFERLLDHHDAFAAGSGARVASLAVSLAQQLNLPPDRQYALALAARLHDIGHLFLPQSLLLSPQPLNAAEQSLLQTHVERGAQLLASVDLGAEVASIVAQHHERLDGSGYPAALRGDQISMEARILAVADVVEAMCSQRSYRPAQQVQAAMQEIHNGSAKVFDATVVSACQQLFASTEGRWPA
jgi:PAS domain S-box-containing protein